MCDQYILLAETDHVRPRSLGAYCPLPRGAWIFPVCKRENDIAVRKAKVNVDNDRYDEPVAKMVPDFVSIQMFIHA
jgi:hypothetical protein